MAEKEIENVEVESLSDEDLETASGGAEAGDSNVRDACCTDSNVKNACCDVER